MGYNIHIQLAKLSINHFHKTLIIPKKKSHFFAKFLPFWGSLTARVIHSRVPGFPIKNCSKSVKKFMLKLYFVLLKEFSQKACFFIPNFPIYASERNAKKSKKKFAKIFFRSRNDFSF